MSPFPPQRLGIYAGSFDPPTNGHLWMIEEGAKLFNTLIVAIGVNPMKKPHFPLEERLAMLRNIAQHYPNVRVESFENEYLVRYAERMGASHILRGIRSTVDFIYEQSLRHINSDLDSRITSVFLTPPRDLGEVSSSTVMALIGPKGWRQTVATMVPAEVAKALEGKFKGD